MNYLLSIILFAFSACSCSSQEPKAAFEAYYQEKDTLNQRKILVKWERTQPNDPELYISYFRYYLWKARQEGLFLKMEQPKNESGNASDIPEGATGQINSKITFDPELLQKGLDKIEEGILQHPNRLDMRFGKIHTLREAGDWDRYTEEIVRTVRYSAKNDNKWSWTPGVDGPQGEQDFLSVIQDYQKNLYDTGEDSLLSNMRTIALEVLKVYPSDVKSLNNLAISYLLEEEYDQALEALYLAEEFTPTDPFVLQNIAYVYQLKGETKKAIQYYEKTIQHGDLRRVSAARQQLEKLKEIEK